jgi:hypothetical protein
VSSSPHLLDLEDDNTPPRVLVNTTPKAGTYLFASIIEELGFHHSYLHLGDNKLQAYDARLLNAGLTQPRKFDVNIRLSESRKLIRKGELAVGHIKHSKQREYELRNFYIVLAVRELRSSLISFARMLAFSEKFGKEMSEQIKNEGVTPLLRARGEARLKQIEAINEWRKCENTLFIRHEDITKKPDESIEKISKFLGVTDVDTAAVHQNAASQATLTKSAGYPIVRWDERAENLFTRLGGPKLNSKLGYDDAISKSKWMWC